MTIYTKFNKLFPDKLLQICVPNRIVKSTLQERYGYINVISIDDIYNIDGGKTINPEERIEIIKKMIVHANITSNEKLIEPIALSLLSVINDFGYHQRSSDDFHELQMEFLREHMKDRFVLFQIILEHWPKILAERELLDIPKKNIDSLQNFNDHTDVCWISSQKYSFLSEFYNKLSSNGAELFVPPIYSDFPVVNNVKYFESSNILEESEYILSIINKHEHCYITIVVPNIDLCNILKKNILKDKKITVTNISDSVYTDPDILIISSLNEKFWTPDCDEFFWLNEYIRQKLQITSRKDIDHAIESAFFSLINNNERIFLTRSRLISGEQVDKSRYLRRFEMFCRKNNINFVKDENQKQFTHRTEEMICYSPPIDVRPVTISAANIELLLQDPYAFYAKKILNLYPSIEDRKRIDFDIHVHNLLQSFFNQEIVDDEILNTILEMSPILYQRTLNIIGWIRNNHQMNQENLTECYGEINLVIDNVPIKITATADRIDTFDDGSIKIIDYKTGSNITERDILYGPKVQLLIESLIASKGGFPGIASNVRSIELWKLKGYGNLPVDILSLTISEELLKITEDKVKDIIRNYLVLPNEFTFGESPRFDNFSHLKRL